jgi:hypothetical protein
VPGIFAAVDDEKLRAEFKAANDAAITAAKSTAAWLESLKESANDAYALGEERFLDMLRAREGVDISIAELKAAGERDLKSNLLALQQACDQYAPETDIRACVLRVQRKPALGQFLRELEPVLIELSNEQGAIAPALGDHIRRRDLTFKARAAAALARNELAAPAQAL